MRHKFIFKKYFFNSLTFKRYNFWTFVNSCRRIPRNWEFCSQCPYFWFETFIDMLLQISNASFLIENCEKDKSCISVKSDSQEELYRLFCSSKALEIVSGPMPFKLRVSRQEFSNSLIMLVKEIDYTNFDGVTQISWKNSKNLEKISSIPFWGWKAFFVFGSTF